VLEGPLGGKYLCLEAGHLAGGGCCLALGPATHDDSHCGIEGEAFGIVDIFVASQATVEGLAEEGQQAVLGVLFGARIKQAAGRHRGQAEGVVEFAIGEESGVAGDGGPVELQFDLTVEVNAQGVILAVKWAGLKTSVVET
jgi:hypothetical protein